MGVAVEVDVAVGVVVVVVVAGDGDAVLTELVEQAARESIISPALKSAINLFFILYPFLFGQFRLLIQYQRKIWQKYEVNKNNALTGTEIVFSLVMKNSKIPEF